MTIVALALLTVLITGCYDGDTCTTSTGEKIRLACIDAPEISGWNKEPVPAKASRDYLYSMLKEKRLIIHRYGTDRHGRTVADLRFENGLIVNELMLDAKHAETYENYATHCHWYKERLLRESLLLKV